ncbi:GNAT family N-acetyltransferase [Ktedonospora formicarum]|uniref:N-acetyltransferase n=1 Tax=Ktedonospora formicarum TaxID=2778364 RepID=A0A8J3HQH5_9CHLR|nr:GNAT family N-acetyltransferase [Ktedonospora formicarum]GHO41927.1 N-acetyltransferase [Ktedonospora formicarum]
MHLDIRKNFEEKVSYVAQHLSGMLINDQSSFLSVDCGLPSDTFNVIVGRDLRAMTPMIAEVDRFIAKGFPFALWCWESTIDKASLSQLARHGLVHTETHQAMYIDLSQLQMTEDYVEGLEITQITTTNELLQFGKIIADLFGDASEGRQVFTYFQRLSASPQNLFPAMRYYLGTLQGKIVTIGTIFVGSQTVGIYDLVTHNDYRRRGIGNTMFQHLLKEARDSNRRFAILQASNDGLGIYLRAGFKRTGDVLTFEVRK